MGIEGNILEWGNLWEMRRW